MKKRHSLITVLVILIPLILFEAAARMKLIDKLTFIPFSDMVISAGKLLANPEYWTSHLLFTLLNILLTFLIATAIGIVLGVFLWRFDYIYLSVEPYMMLSYAVPFIAVYPIFIILFGIGRPSIIVLGVLLAVPTIIINTAIGFRETKPVFIKLTRSFNLTFRQRLFYVYFPSAWPQIFTGLKLGFIYSMLGVISPEFVLSAHGMGYSIKNAYNRFDLYNMYGGIIIILAFSLGVNLLMKYLEAKVYKNEIKGT